MNELQGCLFEAQVLRGVKPGNCPSQVQDLRTAYALLFGAGFVGGHHFYLDRLLHGTIAAPHFVMTVACPVSG
eukprot:g33771.t1